VLKFMTDAQRNSVFMANPVVHAFFVGRALAEAVNQQIETSVTNALSDLGKFDAEQRERWRKFTEQAIAIAERELAAAMQGRTATSNGSANSQPADLQATIDDLRAEIAQLRAELQRYRTRLPS
jgi:uncharacterized protein YceH (UPF0502 family)